MLKDNELTEKDKEIIEQISLSLGLNINEEKLKTKEETNEERK